MKFSLKFIVVAMFILSLIACEKSPDMVVRETNQLPEPQLITAPTVKIDSLEISRVGMFQDVSAYNSRRSVYRVRDTKTGKEYIGISGVGISEMWSHSSGKTQVGDER